jgi:hypothetical protein
MERSSKRGKIPQQDWPSIMARYEAGETLANIARTYDCSPPAISYIVSRSRARGAAPTPSAPPPPEPQLVKSYPTESPPRQPQRGEPPANGPLASNFLQNPPRLETEEGPLGRNRLSGARQLRQIRSKRGRTAIYHRLVTTGSEGPSASARGKRSASPADL